MKLIIAFFTLFFSLSIFAQEETSIIIVKTDSVYQFKEITKRDGKEVATRTFPDDGLGLSAFLDYAFSLSKSEESRAADLKNLRAKVQSNITFLAATIDSLGGAGRYATLQNGAIKQKLQGPWSLIVREAGDVDQNVITVNIQDAKMSSKDKTSNITYVDGETFKLASGILPSQVTFKFADESRYVGEMNGKKIVLKR